MARAGRPVKPTIQGSGSQDDPFNDWAYEALKTAIGALPFERQTGLLKKVHEALAELGYENPGKLKKPRLIEALDSVACVRLDLRPMRHGRAGTCFVMTKLRNKSERHYLAFEKALDGVNGVIEWDQITGRGADYLIRVCGRPGDPRMNYISAALRSLDNVDDVWAAEGMGITKSGVVDNFLLEDFLEFNLKDHPCPPRLHPWQDEPEDGQPLLPNLPK